MKLNLKHRFKTLCKATSLVFRKKTSVFIASLISLAVFFLFLVANYFAEFRSAVAATGNPLIIFTVFWSRAEFLFIASGLTSFLAIVLVALLSGISLTMMFYKFRHTKTASAKGSVSGGAGVFAGALAASCPACSVALISILGVSGGLAVFPLKGLEFSLLALGLLTFSIFMISKSLVECEKCEI